MTQISVRLPDEVVEHIDAEITAGRTPSRAAYLLQACRMKERSDIYERDAEILATIDGDPYEEFAEINEWLAGQPLDHLGEPPEIAPLPRFQTEKERATGERATKKSPRAEKSA